MSLLGKTAWKGTDHCFRARRPQGSEDCVISIPSAPVACTSAGKHPSSAGKNEFRMKRRMLEIVKSSWGREESIE